MKYAKSDKVYCCCGHYIVTTNAVKDKTIKCQICGSVMKEPIKCPRIYIVKAS